jgi:hypothetical protein
MRTRLSLNLVQAHNYSQSLAGLAFTPFGVLAIAIEGALALFVFANALGGHTAALGLPAAATAALQADAARLGAARVPAGVTPEQSAAIRHAICLAFIDAYRVVMLVCAGLAWLGAAMAALLVRGGKTGEQTAADYR